MGNPGEARRYVLYHRRDVGSRMSATLNIY